MDEPTEQERAKCAAWLLSAAEAVATRRASDAPRISLFGMGATSRADAYTEAARLLLGDTVYPTPNGKGRSTRNK